MSEREKERERERKIEKEREEERERDCAWIQTLSKKLPLYSICVAIKEPLLTKLSGWLKSFFLLRLSRTICVFEIFKVLKRFPTTKVLFWTINKHANHFIQSRVTAWLYCLFCSLRRINKWLFWQNYPPPPHLIWKLLFDSKSEGRGWVWKTNIINTVTCLRLF